MNETPMHHNDANWSQESLGRIDQAIQTLGFANLSQFLALVPARPYGEISKQLGDVAPIQIIAVQFQEAKAAGRIRDAAKDSLCRNLVEQLPNGWQKGENADWQTVRALSSWTSEIQVTGECEELKSTLLNVAKCLREVPPPTGWIPTGPDDPIIGAAFDKGWPIESRQKVRRQSYGLLCPKCTAVLTTPPNSVNDISCPHCGEQIELI